VLLAVTCVHELPCRLFDGPRGRRGVTSIPFHLHEITQMSFSLGRTASMLPGMDSCNDVALLIIMGNKADAMFFKLT
jgi:hypothetical protein